MKFSELIANDVSVREDTLSSWANRLSFRLRHTRAEAEVNSSMFPSVMDPVNDNLILPVELCIDHVREEVWKTVRNLEAI